MAEESSPEVREAALSWNLLHPHEARKEARRVKAHIMHLVADKAKRVKELQALRATYTDQLAKAEKQQSQQQAEQGDGGQVSADEARELLRGTELELLEAQRDRLQYARDKLEQTRNRLRDTETDRLYLHVSTNIRPSERQAQLQEQKRDHDDKLMSLAADIERQEKAIASLEKDVEALEASLGLQQQQQAEGGEGEEWSTLYDEASGGYYYYNNYTGETRWA